MKKSVKLILSVVILILLLAAVKFVPASSSTDDASASASVSPEAESLPVLSLQPDQLTSVIVTEGDTSTTYLPPADANGHWTVKDYANVKFNDNTLDYRLSQAVSITAVRKVDCSSLNEYGLDTPSKTVTYNLKDGSQKELLIGNATLDGTSYYALMGDDQTTVYILSQMVNNCITADVSLFRDSALSDFDPNSFSITKLSFSGSDIEPMTVKLSQEQNGVVACYDFTCKDYKDISVSLGTFENLKKALPVVSQDTHLLAANVTDLSAYGLDTARLHIIIDYKAGTDAPAASASPETTSDTHTETLDLTFGNTLSDGQIPFLMGDDKTTVYSIDGSFMNTLKPLLTPYALCTKYYALPDINTVKAVDIDFADLGGKYHLDIDAAAKKYSCNDTTMEEADFKTLYRSVVSLMADKQLEKADSNNTPAFSIVYTLSDGTKTEVKLTCSSVSQYYQGYLYGTMPVASSKKQFEDLKSNLEDAVNGKPQDSSDPAVTEIKTSN